MSYHARIRTEVAEETCPDIDIVIAGIRAAERFADKYGGQCEDAAIADQFGDIERELWGLRDQMEKIRKANKSLRDALTEALRELDKEATP